jgi:hypothetical protein
MLCFHAGSTANIAKLIQNTTASPRAEPVDDRDGVLNGITSVTEDLARILRHQLVTRWPS